MYRYGQEEIDAMARVVRSGQWFRYGEHPEHRHEAARFEQELASYMGSSNCCYLTNGTAALMCGYAGLGLGPGDEVLIPGYTWIASALAAMSVGVIPVLVDIDESLTISPAAIEKAITPRTRAINPVHMAGLACDMDAILTIARRHKLYVVEDACQCTGGVWRDGRKLGSLGDFGAYSFNAFKVISCGEGGAFVCKDRDRFEQAVLFHDCGSNFFGRPTTVPVFGGNLFRGNEITAAMMRVQLGRLDGIVTDLHRIRGEIEAALQNSSLRLAPRNGGAGTGTGGTIGFRFDDEDEAKAFAKSYTESAAAAHIPHATAGVPIDSGRHVYCNWEALMEHRGSYHAGLDPFRHPDNAPGPRYDRDMLPQSLRLLSTTVLVAIHCDWAPVHVDRVIQALSRAQSACTK
jgi:dTDP-4-amino-4,6-dideoxygalactose transaminase